MNDRHGLAIPDHEPGPQDLVTSHDLLQAASKRACIESSANAESGRTVEAGPFLRGLVPHGLLREGKR